MSAISGQTRSTVPSSRELRQLWKYTKLKDNISSIFG